MVAPIKNNLPPESQQWVRDIERRMSDLERQSQRLTRSVTQNAGQIDSIQEAVRSARSGTQSLDLSRIPEGTGSDSVESSLEVPEWARSVAFITTLSVYNLGSAGSISAVLGVHILSGGPEREVASIPFITATPPSPTANNSVTQTRTAPILPGDTHISLSGMCTWSDLPGSYVAAAMWGLTVFWSANPYNEESI